MQALLLGIYSFVWLVFCSWLPWNTVSQVIVIRSRSWA
jgi:hypothetical protein